MFAFEQVLAFIAKIFAQCDSYCTDKSVMMYLKRDM